MRNNRSKNVMKKPGPNGVMTLDVVLMHEDLPACLRGKQALEQLAGELGLETEFCLHLWRFDLMQEHALRNLAVEDARQANIVVLALRHGTELPGPVRTWVQHWLECRSPVPCAIVVSLDSEAQGLATPHPAMQFLRDVSGPAGVDLFQHYGATLPVAWKWATWDMPRTASSGRLEKPDLPQLHAAWGINY